MVDLVIELLPYFLLVVIFLVPLLGNKKINGNKKYFWFCSFVLTAFSALRYGVGWDYFNYCNSIQANGWEVDRWEPLMKWLAKYSNKINFPHFFIFVTGTAIVLFYSIVIYKKSQSPLTSMLVFLCMPFLFLSGLSVVRFALSIAIIFYASLYYKKPVIYFLLVFVAFLIHRAGILGVLVWPFLEIIRVGYRMNWIIFIMGLLCSFIPSSMAPVFSEIVNAFSDIGFLDESLSAANNYLEEVSDKGFTRLPYIYAMVNMFNLVNYKELCRRNPNSEVKKYITLYNIGTSIVLFLSFDAVFASRLGQMFMVFIVLLVPYYITLKTNITYWVIILLLITLYFFQLTIHGNHEDFVGRWNCFLPYKTIFTQIY